MSRTAKIDLTIPTTRLMYNSMTQLGMTNQVAFAQTIEIDSATVNSLFRGKRSLTARAGAKLIRAAEKIPNFDSTSLKEGIAKLVAESREKMKRRHVALGRKMCHRH